MAERYHADESGQQKRPPILHRGSRAGAYALVPLGGALAIAMIALISVLAPPQSTADGTLALEATLDETTLRANWAPVLGAAAYEVRVYDADGRLLRASALDGQTLAVDLDVLELGGVPSVTALDVAALDGVGQILARSERLNVHR